MSLFNRNSKPADPKPRMPLNDPLPKRVLYDCGWMAPVANPSYERLLLEWELRNASLLDELSAWEDRHDIAPVHRVTYQKI